MPSLGRRPDGTRRDARTGAAAAADAGRDPAEVTCALNLRLRPTPAADADVTGSRPRWSTSWPSCASSASPPSTCRRRASSGSGSRPRCCRRCAGGSPFAGRKLRCRNRDRRLVSIIVSAERRSSYRSLWRLRTYARPYAAGLLGMAVAALVSELAPVAVPLIAQRVVDGAIRTGDGGALVPLALLALALGVLEAVAVLVRRWVMTRSALGLETDCAATSTGTCSGCRWRSTTAGSPGSCCPAPPPTSSHDPPVRRLRRWSSSSSTRPRCRGRRRLLAFSYWPLALFVVRSRSRCRPAAAALRARVHDASRRAQDQNGDLTTIVEEAASGIRVIKAFGRRRLVLSGYRRPGAGRCGDAELRKIRVLAYFWALLERASPSRCSRSWCSAAPSRSRTGALTLGGLVAFVSLRADPACGRSSRSAGSSPMARRPRPRPSGSTRCSTRRRPSRTGPARARCRPVARPAPVRGRRLPLPGRRPRRCCAAST